MHTQTRASTLGKQRGIALLEALIAIFLFSLGILALVGLQAVMSKNVTQAKLRGEASFLANQLIGQMWVDQANLARYAVTEGVCVAAAGATANANCSNWLTSVQQALPSGSADVAINGNQVNISLNWQLPGEIPGGFQIDATITN
jgi:type IV pilus assembly protein PilV